MNNSKFEVGKVYRVGSANYKIVKRTEKSVWIQGYGRRAITLDSRGVECVYPEGMRVYSISPRICADRNEVK
jgi:hypothetical protein